MLGFSDGDARDRLICATCVSRLREANAFKRQVLLCEEKLLQSRIIMHEDSTLQNVKTEVAVKDELDQWCGDNNDTYTNMEKCKDKIAAHADSLKSRCIESCYQKKSAPSEEHLQSKKQLLYKMQRTKERLRKLQHTGKSPELYPEQSTVKFIDDDFHSFKNNVTIVENSYICPFQTSYSCYSCVYCKANFEDPAKLREHTMKHDATKFRTVSSKKAIYFDIERIGCRLCDNNIIEVDQLKTHLSQIHAKRFHEVPNKTLMFKLETGPLSCTVCGTVFTFFHALKRHMAEHFGSVVCDYCGLHFLDMTTLKAHTKNAHGVEENTCHQCGKLFSSKHNMLSHVSSVHKRQAVFQCSRCDQVLFSRPDRHKHLSQIHGVNKLFKCESCGKVYYSMNTLREHKRAVHLMIFKHKCTICDRRFALPSRLNEHFMSTHRGEKNFHCDMCGKSYPRLHYLKLHIKSHATQ